MFRTTTVVLPVGHACGQYRDDGPSLGFLALGGASVLLDALSFAIWDSAAVGRSRADLIAAWEQRQFEAREVEPAPIATIVTNLVAEGLLVELAGDPQADRAALTSLRLVAEGRGLPEDRQAPGFAIATSVGTINLLSDVFHLWEHAHWPMTIVELVNQVASNRELAHGGARPLLASLYRSLPLLVYGEAAWLDQVQRREVKGGGFEVDLSERQLWRARRAARRGRAEPAQTAQSRKPAIPLALLRPPEFPPPRWPAHTGWDTVAENTDQAES